MLPAKATQIKLFGLLATKAIRESKIKCVRRTTLRNLDIVRHAVEGIVGAQPTDATIWKSIRHRDINRRARDYLWKCLHGAHRIGEWWRNIPDHEHRALCLKCGVDETMDHILTDCDIPGQQIIWRLVKHALIAKRGDSPQISFGLILGCGALSLSHGKQKLPGTSRLLRILISESAHLIWKLRCERVMERGTDPASWHNEREIRARWAARINQRLKLDQAQLRSRYRSRTLTKDLVLCTWSGVLQDEHQYPDDWVSYAGVLVGMGPTLAMLQPPGCRHGIG